MYFDDSANGGNIRIRGIGQRNYNTLLLINGRPVNQKADQGSVAELNNWDITDYERIEVVKGPGSVIHGPGAISGIINLVTKKAGSSEGLTLGLSYNPSYQSKGLYIDYGMQTEKTQWLIHMSMVRTKGYGNLKIYQFNGNGEHGYKSTDAFTNADANTVANYFADADDKPQIKISMDVSFFNYWRLWSRYSSSGNTGTVTKNEYPDGEYGTHEFRDQFFIATLENDYAISDQAQVHSLISFDSESYYATNAKVIDINHNATLNRTHNFSENEWFLKSIINYQWSQDLSLSAGIEYSHDYLAKPWGDSAKIFRAGTSKRNFITEDSVYRGDGKNGTIKDEDIVEFNDGWSSDTYSVMAEADYLLVAETRAILSAIYDKNEYTKSMFSPRVAIISHLNDRNILKASWQRSLRMNTMTELYIEELEGNMNDPEEIEATELSYTHIFNKNLHSTITAYHYNAEIIAWSGEKSELVGKQQGTGFEFELAYATEN